MVKTTKPKLTVKTRKLAFWPSLEENETPRYLESGEQVTLLKEKFYYLPPIADKPYYYVNHHVYGDGYVLAEAF